MPTERRFTTLGVTMMKPVMRASASECRVAGNYCLGAEMVARLWTLNFL